MLINKQLHYIILMDQIINLIIQILIILSIIYHIQYIIGFTVWPINCSSIYQIIISFMYLLFRDL